MTQINAICIFNAGLRQRVRPASLALALSGRHNFPSFGLRDALHEVTQREIIDDTVLVRDQTIKPNGQSQWIGKNFKLV